MTAGVARASIADMDVRARVQLCGHGWRFTPIAPFEIGRLANGDPVIVHHKAPNRPKIRLGLAEEGIRVALGPGTTSIEEVLDDWHDGEPPGAGGFRLAFSDGYEMPWPGGTSVWSTGARWPVELTLEGSGDRDQMLYIEGPFAPGAPPVLRDFVFPGMAVMGRQDLAGIEGPVHGHEVGYVHQGKAWRQWRYVVALGNGATLLVTAQASGDGIVAMSALGAEVARQARTARAG